ncbi:MAG: cytochrome c oxidase subunit I [Solirubrobacterales bacterium]|nr:cytochrome c oxidase subunit I [Solirubrobacterales bacterium]
MSATDAGATARPEIVVHGRSEQPRGWLGWIATTDHKRIGILYLVATFVFFLLGGVEALLMRIQLGAPDATLIPPERYNALMTMHGTTMIFLFVVPVWAGFANYVVPLMIGARDMAFPRLNALSFWLLAAGGLTFYGSLFFSPPEAGWTSYTPLSTGDYIPGSGQDAWIFLVHLTGLSSLLGAINLLVTIVNMRAPGMSWGRLPLFCWSVLAQSIMLILALPAIAAAVTMQLTDRHFGTCFFEPSCGGDSVLYQHLFWFFGHPEVYIMILPAFGAISEILPVFARKPIFGYKAIAASTFGIAFISMLVWAHHMFTAPVGIAVMIVFMVSSMLVAIPTGVKVLNWVATLWRGSIVFRTPLYFAVGFLALFTFGGITGVMLAIFPFNWQAHDSYFVVGHFHYVLVAGSVNGIFAALYYWYPKITGRMMSETLGKLSFWLTFIGFNMTFLVQHSLGLSGMPRRISHYPAEAGWGTMNLISTVGSLLLGIGVVVTVYNAIRSRRHGRRAGNDPWHANTLEWLPPSPPPAHNFDVLPRVRSVTPMRDIRATVAARDAPRADRQRA